MFRRLKVLFVVFLIEMSLKFFNLELIEIGIEALEVIILGISL